MQLKTGVYLIIATFLGGLHISATGDTERHRDLTLYDKAGPYTLERPREEPDQMRKVEEIRDFLWKHWKGHRLGYLEVTSYGLEGQKTNTRYFVEASPAGRWYVAIELETEVITAKGTRAHPRYSYVATVVDRVELPKGEIMTPERSPIPDNETRTADSYQILFKDESGKVLSGM